MRYASSLLALAIAGALFTPPPADAEVGRLWANVKVADNALAETPAMGTITTPDGVVLDQAEHLLVKAPNQVGLGFSELPPGIYDVRVEGDGFVTEVKKGVHVFAGRDEYVSFLVRPGVGVHIVEYAVAGLSREEVAARLAQLESETARLRAELESLRAAAPEQP